MMKLVIRSLCIGLLFWLTPVAAKIYTAPILAEAHQLLDTNPEQARIIAERFLSQRRLTAPKGSSSVHINDETDRAIRTPMNTIDALQIQAQALSQLNAPRAALQAIKEAELIAKNNSLTYTYLESKLIRSQILWQQTRNTPLSQALLDEIAKDLTTMPPSADLSGDLYFRLALLNAELQSAQNNAAQAIAFYKQAQNYLANDNTPTNNIQYHLSFGQHYLDHKQYDQALTELLAAYWRSVSEDNSGLLAKTNFQLAKLFFQRQVLDKSIEHASQAAEFYGRFNYNQNLADILNLMAEIYFRQGRYNLALVHYFNVLDQEKDQQDLSKVIQLRLDISKTYLNLYNYTLSDQYLKQAKRLVSYTQIKPLQARTLLLEAELLLTQDLTHDAITNIQSALTIAQHIERNDIKMEGEKLLSLAYELSEEFKLSLQAQRRYEQLFDSKQARQNEINEDVFRQQKEIIEKTLHYQGLEQQLKDGHKEFRKMQKVAFALFCLLILISAISFRRGRLNNRLNRNFDKLRHEFYTHPRSGLRNLRLLTARLPSSLQQSSAHFEQWHLGELINEPLSDRLRFALIDVPFLRHVYLHHGYQEGLALEKEFGEYLKQHIQKPSRLYHFSDAAFLYIEPNSNPDKDPQQLADMIQSIIDNFSLERTLDRRIRTGITEYPFLPRAYTAINDRELIDILLMATHFARQISKSEPGSHWVHLSAIESAPAASFATDNIRLACQQAINQGLVKVQTSSDDDINWSDDHESVRNMASND